MRYYFMLFGILQSFFNLFNSNAAVMDDQIIQGKLDNGMTYYIRENAYPKEKASLRLVVKVGSIHEQEGEEGIAHFIEHLAFRGSEHFQDGEVFRYLESIGCAKFADSNAATRFESTSYLLDIPLNKENALETALIILSDFASTVTLSDEVIEKERNVVLDELHQNVSSKNTRYWNKVIHSFLPDSPYAQRLPIGHENVIKTVSSKILRDFYKRWYRPDRMAIIAVGDFDGKELQKKIEECFSKIVCPKENVVEPPKEMKYLKEPQAVIHFDPELQGTSVSLFSFYSNKYLDNTSTKEDFKNGLLSYVCIKLLKACLNKLENTTTNFFGTSVGKINSFSDTTNIFYCEAGLFEDRFEENLRALHQEIQRVLKQGFTQAEWQKLNGQLKTKWQNHLANSDKITHESYASGYNDHFLKNYSLISDEWLIKTWLEFAESMTVEEINAFLPSSHLADRFMIFLSTPSQKVKESINERDLLKLFSEEVSVTDSEVKDAQADLSFNINPKLPSGKIAHIQEDQKAKVTYWTLDNGIKLILKNTDLEHDQVHIFAHAQGGLTAFSEEDFHSAKVAIEHGILSGVFNGLFYDQMRDILHSKDIGVDLNLGLNSHSIDLKANQNHLETAFQLIHSFFTSHSFDQKKWEHLITKNQEYLRRQFNDPNWFFSKFVSEINRQNHFYFQPLDIEQTDEKKAREIFEFCYGNPQDFTFVIVGDFNQNQIRHFVEKYLGSLPQNPHEFFPSPVVPELFPQKIVHEELRKGHNSYATTLISMPCDVSTIYRQYGNFYSLRAVDMILNQRLTENLRHQLGNTYGVGAYLDSQFFDFSNSLINIQFTSQPEHRKNMVDLVFKEIETLKTAGPSQEEISVIKTLLLEKKKKSVLSNWYWIEMILLSQQRNISLDYILDYEKPINELTIEGVQKAAQIMFSSPHYTVLSHLPEEGTDQLAIANKTVDKAD